MTKQYRRDRDGIAFVVTIQTMSIAAHATLTPGAASLRNGKPVDVIVDRVLADAADSIAALLVEASTTPRPAGGK